MADLEWAEDPFYADGVTPTKVEPGSGIKDKGAIPDEANVSAQEFNWHVHELSSRQNLQEVDRQIFTVASDTWNKPSNALWSEIVAIGSGGSGGGGAGGGGGSSGQLAMRRITAAELPDSLAIVVGQVGVPGASTVIGDGVQIVAVGGNDGGTAGGGGVGGPAVVDGWAGGDGSATGGGSGNGGGVGYLGVAGQATLNSGGGGGRGWGAGGGGGGGASDSGGGGGSGYGSLDYADDPTLHAEDGTGAGGGGDGANGVVIITTWCAGTV